MLERRNDQWKREALPYHRPMTKPFPGDGWSRPARGSPVRFPPRAVAPVAAAAAVAEFALRDKSQSRNSQDTKSQPRNYERIICGQFEHCGVLQVGLRKITPTWRHRLAEQPIPPRRSPMLAIVEPIDER
jgi:hypothetical protein